MSIVMLPRPAVTAPLPWTPPIPEVFNLDNDVRCYAQHLPGQHVAHIRVHLGIDLNAEPAGCDGIAAVLADCLRRGTASLTADEFSAALAEAGIAWSTAVDHTGPSIICQMPASQLDTALDLIADALAAPRLDPQQVALAVQLHAAKLAQAGADAQTRAMVELPGLVLDPATRAGRPADGTLGTAAEITAEAIAAFHANRLRAARTAVVIAGDLTGCDVAATVEASLGDWSTPAPDAALGTALDFPYAPVLPHAPTALLIGQPGAEQTHLLLAASTISRHHPDWPALATAVQILGAPVTGRIDARLRQERGDTYGIRATLPALTATSGQLALSGYVAGASTTAVTTDLLTLLGEARDGFTPAECARAQEALLGQLPLAYEHAELVAATIADLHTHRLLDDFYARALDRIRDMTPDDINRAYRDHVDPSRLSVATVGDPTCLEALGEHLPMPITHVWTGATWPA